MQNKRLNMYLRLATGAVLTGGIVVLVTNISGISLPDVRGEVVSMQVTPATASYSTIVCQGPFAVLGADTANPGDALPTGSSDVTVIGSAFSEADLSVAETKAPAKQLPTALTVGADELLSAALSQSIKQETVAGMTAINCPLTLSDQWLVAGDTKRGTTATIVLSNPGQVPATVSISVYDELGTDVTETSSGVLVAAGEQRVVSLGGFGAGRQSTVVRVQSAGAAVAASMSVTEIQDLMPIGADQVNAQQTPTRELYFAGVVNYADHTHAIEDDAAEHLDEYPAVLRLLTLSDSGSAKVVGYAKDGEQSDLGTVQLTGGVVHDTQIAHLPEGVVTVAVKADVPVVGGLKTAVHTNNEHDFMWMAPSEVFAPGQQLPMPVVADGKGIVFNSSGADVEVTATPITGAQLQTDKAEVFSLKPGASKELAKNKSFVVTATGEIIAGVTIFEGKNVSNYPLLRQAETLQSITIYPR